MSNGIQVSIRMTNNPKLIDIVDKIKLNIPPEVIFDESNAATLIEHKDLLLAKGPGMVDAFYATLMNYEKTKEIFKEGELPDRMRDFLAWWERSVQGPFDNSYWEWQAFVGVIHVQRGVTNAMMLSMWGWLQNYIEQAITDEVDSSVRLAICQSLRKLASTAQAYAADSFMETYVNGVMRATGFKRVLLDRMVHTEIDDIVKDHRD